MNTQLRRLFEKYNFSKQNIYEINQIFSFLPKEKQINLINNFDIFAQRINEIERELDIEKQILIPKAIDNIKNVLEEAKKERISNQSKWKIDLLKQEV